MRELLMTHRLNYPHSGTAIVVLVDYDTFEAKSKVVKYNFTDEIGKWNELKELMDSGKLKNVTEHSGHDGMRDVWVAMDCGTGRCIVVMANGSIVYSDRYIDDKGFSVYSTAGAGQPLRVTNREEAPFWETVEQLKEKYNCSLKDKEMRRELAVRTGVFIQYSGSSYSIEANGLHIDKLMFNAADGDIGMRDVGKLSCYLCNGTADEVYVDGLNDVHLNGAIGKVYIDDEVERLNASGSYTKGVSADLRSYEIIPTGSGDKLNKLTGYMRKCADLSMFRNLRYFSYCWEYVADMRGGSEPGVYVPIDIKLPLMDDGIFGCCFERVDLRRLEPYLDNGVLDISFGAEFSRCFNHFSGISHITGKCEKMTNTFLSSTFRGTFDITVGTNFLDSLIASSDVKFDELPVGTVNIVLKGNAEGSGQYISYHQKNDGVAWRQKQIISSESSLPVKLQLKLKQSIEYEVNTEVLRAHIVDVVGSKENLGNLVFNKPVGELVGGNFLFNNIRKYGDRCFKNRVLEREWVAELEEGVVEAIGDRAFEGTHGIRYLVIPRSVQHIGAAAFAGMRCDGVLSTICVYRDSYAHLKWAKGKKLDILVIDSIDDIPKQTKGETETDFLAALVDVPNWADKSKPFVAKLLYAGNEIDMGQFEHVVGKLSPEAVEYLAGERDSYTDKWPSVYNAKIESARATEPVSDGRIAGIALLGAAMDAVYGSQPELLDADILKSFTWGMPDFGYGGHCIWVGESKADINGKSLKMTLIERNGDVLYIGCGRKPHYFESYMSKFDWQMPLKAHYCDNLIGDELQGRLHLITQNHGELQSVTVNNEGMQGDALEKARSMFLCSMLEIYKYKVKVSGRRSAYSTYFYDFRAGKIYKFGHTSLGDSAAGIGVFQGVVGREDIPAYREAKSDEELCRSLAGSFSEDNVGMEAKPCFEAEFVRMHKPFKLASENEGDLKQVLEFFAGTDFARSITKSKFNSKVTYLEMKAYKDGMLEHSRTSNGTFVCSVTLGKDTSYFETSFDVIKFTALTDERLSGKQGYVAGNGFFEVVHFNPEDVVRLIPITPKYKNHRFEIDSMTGKLVLTRQSVYHDDRAIICSFDSSADVTALLEEFGCKSMLFACDKLMDILNKGIDFSDNNQSDTVILKMRDYIDSVCERVCNSLLKIGGDTLSVKRNVRNVYSMAVLKYCRK